MLASDADIDRLLCDLDIAAEPFALCELRGQCSLNLGRDAAATLHLVLAGNGQFRIAGAEPLPLRPGHLVLVPAGRSHWLESLDAPGASLPGCRPAGLCIARHLAEGSGAGGLAALCARVTVSLRGAGGLTTLLRRPLQVDCMADARLAGLGAALTAELSYPAPGGRAMIRALLLQGMIGLMRGDVAGGVPAMRWLPVLGDRRLWAALRAMLDAPGAPHTLESLAAEAGMGRSRLALRFRALTGQSPMDVLRELRLAEATWLLLHGDQPVERIASAVGFRSRSAFTRAFLRARGVAPSELRRGALREGWDKRRSSPSEPCHRVTSDRYSRYESAPKLS